MHTITNKEEVYEKREVAWFYRKVDPFYELSNMCNGMPLEYEGRKWKSSEHLYQASKYSKQAACIPESARGKQGVEPNVIERIFQAKTCMASKMTQKCAVNANLVRSDWHDVMVRNMLYVVELKVFHNPQAMSEAYKLSKTRPIVEISSRDMFWGCKRYSHVFLRGNNMLGKVHMSVRTRLDEVIAGEFKAPANFFID